MSRKLFLLFYFYSLFGKKDGFLITTTNHNKYLHILIYNIMIGYHKYRSNYRSYLSRKIKNNEKFFVSLKNNKLIYRNHSFIWK